MAALRVEVVRLSGVADVVWGLQCKLEVAARAPRGRLEYRARAPPASRSSPEWSVVIGSVPHRRSSCPIQPARPD
eukprot:3217678-Pyramimonas_sp.AAC.1